MELAAARIRAATQADMPIIRALIREEQLDPTSLDWRHFLIAEVQPADGGPPDIAGIGQVKVLPGAHELGSLIVRPEYRGRGIAGQLIRALEEDAPRPLFLLCERRMQSFYARYGFQPQPVWRAPLVMQIKYAVPTLLYLGRYQFAVMRKDGR